MKTILLYFINKLMFFLPETRFFALKRFFYRCVGYSIGNEVRICSSVKILGTGNLTIGSNTWIGPEVVIISSSSVIIGECVDIAPKVYIGTGTHEFNTDLSERVAGKGLNKNVEIKNGCWIGVNSTILPGVTIGEKVMIAAGAVVNKSIDSHSLVVGNPGRVIKKYDFVSKNWIKV